VATLSRVSAHATAAQTDPVTVIVPPKRWSAPHLGELWHARELLYFITKRELQIRYKQSFFGVLWAVVQPLALAGVFGIFFGSLAQIPSDGIPYLLFALSGLLAWLFASQAVGQAANSLVGDANLIAKVYFPRVVIPLGKMVALVVDVTITFVVVLIAIALYGIGYRVETLLVPVFLVLALVTAAGVGIALAALNVKYRDVTMAVPLAVQLWLFLTPVLYPGSLVTGGWQYIYAVNPMVSAVQGVRWALLGTPAPSAASVVISTVSAIALLLLGALYFRRTEHYFADVI
jgi:lipopolysaccharide transport system permease protein